MLSRDIGRRVRLPAEVEQDIGFRFLQAQPPGSPLESLDSVRRSRPPIAFVARVRFRCVSADIGCRRRIFSMSNPSPIRTASTSRFTLSRFTLRTDSTTSLLSSNDSRQVYKLSIIALVVSAPPGTFISGHELRSGQYGGCYGSGDDCPTSIAIPSQR